MHGGKLNIHQQGEMMRQPRVQRLAAKKQQGVLCIRHPSALPRSLPA